MYSRIDGANCFEVQTLDVTIANTSPNVMSREPPTEIEILTYHRIEFRGALEPIQRVTTSRIAVRKTGGERPYSQFPPLLVFLSQSQLDMVMSGGETDEGCANE